MNNIKLILLSILFLNASCAQKDNTIVSPKINNYELVNVFEKVDIPWSIEFLDDETIIYAEKKGEIFIIKDGKSIKIQNVPEVYLRGQGGLLDLELHPNFSENKLIYMSYASGSRDDGGGNTAISRAKLIDDQLVDVKLLYKAEGNSTKGQHFGSRLQFDNDGKLFFAITELTMMVLFLMIIHFFMKKIQKKKFTLMAIEILKACSYILKLAKFGQMNMVQKVVMK
jgi:glucose/arabinose dehydrogenase